MSKIKNIVAMSKYYGSFLSPELVRLRNSAPRTETLDVEKHLAAAAAWLCAAQDAFDDGGVARSYAMVYSSFFNKKGWITSYPETTGYIIPTFFDYAVVTGSHDIKGRAIRMADWECEVQMECGAVQGGTIDAPKPTPAIFNTGQVIFGWVRAYRETRDDKYLSSAIKAGRYLTSQQDSDGAWRKNLSDYTSSKLKTYTYNTRTSWALLVLFSVTDDVSFKEAAVRNIEFSLGQQLQNGWFKDNCLFNKDAPLLHTIAYSIRGILESGVLLNNAGFIDAAKKPADALIGVLSENGSMPGRLDKGWSAAVDYSCLTGNAQTAIIWGRLYQLTGEKKYLDAQIKANSFLKRVQVLDTGNPGLYGGISGSYPLNGIYGCYEILNWAVKFFIDSLLLEKSILEAGGSR